MQMENDSLTTQLRRWMRAVSRLGASCGVAAMLVLVTGCPPTTMPCTEDTDCEALDDGMFCTGDPVCQEDGTCGLSGDPCAEGEMCDEENDRCAECGLEGQPACDDMDMCTTDMCVDGTCEFTPVECPEGEQCDPADGMCVECLSNDDCADDGMFCNGMEVCGEDNTCGSTGDPCMEGEVCDEDTDMCGEPCVDDTDCDDGNACTTDTCEEDGTCTNMEMDVDDDLFCNGTETCDPDTGDVTSSGDPCDEGEFCNEEMDACEMDIACTEDADCNDDLFCNGTETCMIAEGEEEGVCVAGDDPCADDEECDEENDECDFTGEVENFRLTLTTDNFTGGSGPDTFDGALEVSGGNFFQTLNNSDFLDGAGGSDTLTAQFQGGGTTTPGSLAGIDVISCEVTDANNTTLNLLNADAVTTLRNVSSQADLTITNLSTVPSEYSLSNVAHNFNVTITNTALTGSSDAASLTLSGIVAAGGEPVVTLQPSAAGSGYETITVVSEGNVANSLDDLVDGNGTTFATLNVEGNQNFMIVDPLATTVTTVDGSAAAGNINLTFGAASHTLTGGSGDDTFNLAGNYDTTDSIDGGDGTDIFASTSADLTGTAAAVSNVMNMETVSITNQLAGNLNVGHYGAMNALIAGFDGTARTITVPTGASVEFTADGGAANHVVAVATDTSADTVSLTLTDADFGANLVLSTWETVNLASAGAPDGGANVVTGTTALNNTFATETLTITGTAALTFTGAVTADVLDASAFTGALTMTGGTANSTSITGGTAADTLRGSASADSISGGDGADTIRGDDGADSLTGGNGNDTFNGDNGDSDELLTVTDTITDFDAGTSTTSNDIFLYDITSIEATTGVTDLVDTSANSAAGGNNTYVALSTDGATVSNADIVGIIGDYADATAALAAQTSWTITYGAALTDNDAFLVAYTSGSNVRIAVAIDNGGGATSDAVDTLFDIAILQNVSLANLNSGDFNSQ